MPDVSAVMMLVVESPGEPDAVGARSHDLRALYETERVRLVRLAALLVREVGEAEEIVQDAFVAAHLRWDRLREPDKALAYLRSTVMNGARSRLRHRRVVERTPVTPLATVGSAESGAIARDDHRRMIDALATLPMRQRECLALRYYLDLSEAEIASTLGISAGSVKTHTHRGLAALQQRLEEAE
jgi:RNA polymerase sigma-70 factor (sigma-E family)